MRWIVRLFAVLVSLIVLGVGALFLLPAERIAGLAAQQFEARTGRALTIEGSVSPTVWPVVGARVENVTLASPGWAQAGPLLSAEVLDMGLDFSALFSGNFTIRRFELRGARVVLERDAQGRANWEFEGLGGGAESAETAEPGGAGGIALSMERVEIRDAALRFIDRASGTDLALDGMDVDLSMPDLDGPGRISLSGRMQGQAISAEVELARLSGFLAGQVTGVSLNLQAGGAQVGFQGRAGFDPPAAEGRLSLQAPALAPLLALAGQSGPEPLPATMRPLDLSGQVTLAPSGSLHLREGRMSAGSLRAELALDLATDGPRPRLTGQVTAGALDLRPFLGGESGGTPAAAAPGWPTDRIDASALAALDAEIGLTAGPVQTGLIDLERLSAVLAIDRARAVLTLREARAFDGNITGELVANNRSGLSVGGNVTASGLGLLPLLRDTAGFERLTGTAGFSLRFLSVGQSVDAIMRSLSGEGRLDLGQGEIIGLDLAGMLRNLDMGYMGEGSRTVYDSITGSFAIEGGVLNNEDLRLNAPRLTVEGRGRVDLGGQRLDYRVTPVALQDAESGRAIRVPLVISGPWDAPRFRLDLEGLAEERLREEAERLEQRAREEAARLEARAREEAAAREAELRARAEEELRARTGIERTEGESAREAAERGARERAEREIGRGLRRLLGSD